MHELILLSNEDPRSEQIGIDWIVMFEYLKNDTLLTS
jgi:hypothetical protein